MAKTKKAFPKKSKPSPKRKGGSRRSRAESMTGKKANAVEVRTVGFGDNSELALPEPADYEHHYKSIKGLQDKAATAQSLVRHAVTAANKSCPGMGASIKETIFIEREGDPIKLQKRLELLGIGLKQVGSSIQISIFDTLAGDETELVYKRGVADGKAGKTANNRYPEGSLLHSTYAKGWRHGTSSNLGLTPEQSDSAFEDEDADKVAAE